MQFQDLKAIIDFAIEKEKEAAEFYEEVAGKETMSGSKEMFLEFAAEEKKHQALLENLDNAKIESYEFKWITDIKRSDYVVDLEYDKGMGFKDILMLAMKREEKALALYNKLQDESENEDHKKIFKMLCQEEAKHKLALETMFDNYMAKMGD